MTWTEHATDDPSYAEVYRDRDLSRWSVHTLSPASLDEALDAVEKPEDCERDCFRHGGDLPCECEDQEGGVWQPGC